MAQRALLDFPWDLATRASAQSLVDRYVDRIGDEPSGAVPQDDMNARGVAAGEILEVPDLAIGWVICHTEEAGTGLSSSIDPAVPNGPTKPA